MFRERDVKGMKWRIRKAKALAKKYGYVQAQMIQILWSILLRAVLFKAYPGCWSTDRHSGKDLKSLKKTLDLIHPKGGETTKPVSLPLTQWWRNK